MRTRRPGFTLPVMTAGSPSHDAWGSIIGQTVSSNQQGKTTSLVQGSSTAWVSTAHPDVATYNCCEGDHSETCCDGTYDDGSCTGGYGWSWDLAQDETAGAGANPALEDWRQAHER